MDACGSKCSFSKKLLDRLELLNSIRGPDADIQEVIRAIEFAKKHHHGQFRATGEPFYSHTIEVAFMAADYCHKTDVIVASILHDVVEDTDATIGSVLDNFGWRVAEIVSALTRKRPGGERISAAQLIEGAAQSRDLEAVLIKVLDRVHNLQTLSPMCIEKQKRIAKETIDAFLPYAMEFDPELEKTLNLLSVSIVEPSLVRELEFLYSKKLLASEPEGDVLPPILDCLPA